MTAEYVLLIVFTISVPCWIICGVVIWKVLDDCKKRRLRRERQQEFTDGRRPSDTGTISLG
jgi:hypothetical protein